MLQIDTELHREGGINHIKPGIVEDGIVAQLFHASNEALNTLGSALVAVALATDVTIVVDLETTRGSRMTNDQC